MCIFEIAFGDKHRQLLVKIEQFSIIDHENRVNFAGQREKIGMNYVNRG